MSIRKDMACEQVEALLGALADGELNKRQAAAVREHLDGCPSCARKLADLEQLSSLVTDAVTEEPLPPTLHDSVMRVVRESAPDRRPLRASAMKRWGTVVACGVCLVVVAIALFSGGRGNVVMEGIFDSKAETPDATMEPDAEDNYGGADFDSDSSIEDVPETPHAPITPNTPAEPAMPDEPMSPEKPMDPDQPTADEVQSVYMLKRADGTVAGTWNGDWIGESMRLSFVEPVGEVKVSYSGWSESRVARYTAKNGELLLVYEDGGEECFTFDCKEGVLWLTRK